MAELSIAVLNGQGEVKCLSEGVNDIWLVHQGEYRPGDRIVFTTDEIPAFYMIRVDGAMDEAYVYLTRQRVEYIIPFEQGNPFQTDRISFCPGSFVGERHYIAMRRTREPENENYRNLAKNVMDQMESEGCYPHVRANAATKGPIAPLFAARNVIDGVLANTCHWPWPFQSWGIDQRKDAEITVEFGRPVDMDELRLTTRADFPHDSWWEQATVSFSDGSREVLRMEKSQQPHVFPIRRRNITWLTLGELIQADDPSPFPALTQIEVFGRNSCPAGPQEPQATEERREGTDAGSCRSRREIPQPEEDASLRSANAVGVDRAAILAQLRSALEPLPYIYAFWLEGADAAGTADAYSDIDCWVDFEDHMEQQALAAVEEALEQLAPIDYKYVMHHSHPKIRQRIYHLAGSDEYLMIDFCWQLHSRPAGESTLYENDPIEAAKVIFDKAHVIRHRPMEPRDFAVENQARLEEACYRRTQHCRVVKYIRRGQYPEAFAYYNRYVLEPLIDLLRLLHTPAHADYYLVHISQHIPQEDLKRLEFFARIGSSEEIEAKIPQAEAWFDALLERLKSRKDQN